ncbi:riboflavin synthase subunit alpha [Vibrio sp. ZSDZ65]|uniref:Riboflavin synthase n=1 Tax=Vibrio qingdaonensis TaxID=2829491 RepID=A0A9X3CKD4_9VIBR|nr:riboflavin synthase subunit alpha [Vibrio qingdaonensis]MCW8345044.1 riboflavin synthase subunit alpha [Vibrio qingdaonensis]
MFTGIIQSVAIIEKITDLNGIRTFEINFPAGFCVGLEIGASVAVDGVCLTVTELVDENRALFDVMLQSLLITTLSDFKQGQRINVERAAKDGAEIGGHPLSGHVDFKTTLVDILQQEDNYRIRFSLPKEWKPYVFPKGYIAINGASLTVSEVDKEQSWFDVWLIPETLRMTTFGHKGASDYVNIEIERGTQVVVDTVRDTIKETLGPLLPMFEKFLEQHGANIDVIGQETTRHLSDKK